jgi:hypothetical protein
VVRLSAHSYCAGLWDADTPGYVIITDLGHPEVRQSAH